MEGATIIESKHPPRLVVNIYSHHFSVERILDRDTKMLLDFSRPLGQYGPVRVGRGKFIQAIVRVYAAARKDRSEFRFHISQLEDFFYHCRNYGVNKDYIRIIEHHLHEPTRIDLKYIDKRTPLDYQAPVIDYIVSDGKFKIVELDPGRGKTFIALSAIQKLKVRTFFCIKAQYIDKWIQDAKEAFDFKPGELMVIKGSKSLRQLLELGMAGELEAKIILCSSTTFGIYLREYEEVGEHIRDVKWPCLPHEIWKVLGIGLKVVDESHEFLHFNYKMTMYTHVHKTLDLSGTLLHDDPFIKRILEILHPKEIRFTESERKVHSTAEALLYSIRGVDRKVKYMNNTLQSYSHIMFEKSIMKNNLLLDSYVDMIIDITNKRFVEHYQKGLKMAIYFSTKDMCTKVTDIFKEQFPEFNIERYIGEDDYDTMRTGDIIITTLKSMGTAVDVPGLFQVLMTDSLGSKQLNIQVLGRLRPLKGYGDINPNFMYLVCSDISKQLNYHRKKLEMFNGRVIDHKTTHTNYSL